MSKNSIWEYFYKSNEDSSKAVCKICKKSYSLGSHESKKQTIHGLKQHLLKFHDEENKKVLKRKSKIELEKQETKQKQKENNIIFSSIQPTIPDLAKQAAKSFKWPDDHEISFRIDKAIMDLIIVDMLPYSLVEGAAFRRLNLSDPAVTSKYNFKSEKYFRTSLMPKTYEKVKIKVMNLIEKAEWISFTTDVWTNPCKSCSLLSFTAHFITESKRLKVILGASVLQEDHTGAYIAEKLTEIANEFNVINKIHFAIRDNAANMCCATHIAQFESLGCMAHTLQLVINDAIFSDSHIENVIKSCRKIVGHFRRSEQASRNLTECQKQCGLSLHSLIQDIEVRWNSTYLMLERLLEQKNSINLYSVEHGKINTLNSTDWELIKKVTNVLKFFYEATLEISFDNACISLIIPLVSLLNQKLQSQDDHNDPEVVHIKKQLSISLNKRFAYIKNQPSLISATLLDPRFKSKYLTSVEVDVGIKEICNFLNQSNSSDEPVVSINSTVQLLEKSKEGLWDSHDQSPDHQKEITDLQEYGTAYERTMHYFLKEPRLQRNADIYEYWFSSPYQNLRKAVLKYLSAPPTSVASEQLFSAAGQIFADRRSNLLGENAEKLLFLAYNIRLFNFDY